MNTILIKKQVGGLRVFSLVREGSEVKCLRTTGVIHEDDDDDIQCEPVMAILHV
jgi:hypothetical protein